jgi:hypothetical protein
MIYIFSHALPAVSTFISGIFFISIGLIFGFSNTTDSFFLILSIQGIIGIVFQICWYSLIPLLYSRKPFFFRSVIVSTAIANMLMLGVLYIFLGWSLEEKFPSYFNLFASTYFLIFQLHIFFKQLLLSEGRLKPFYLLDIVGYTASLIALLLLSTADSRLHTLSNIFMALTLAWGGVCVVECYLQRKLLKPVYSKKLSLVSLLRAIVPRIAGLLYNTRDFIIPLLLHLYTPTGTVTLYAYINRFLLALYQTVSLHIVNIWISSLTGLSGHCTLKNVRKTAVHATLAFVCSTTLAVLVLGIFSLISQADKINGAITSQSVFIFFAVFTLFTVQTFEQAYSRLVYLKQYFDTQVKADICNSLIFLLAAAFSFSIQAILPMLIGAVFSQALSFLIYRHKVMRVFES